MVLLLFCSILCIAVLILFCIGWIYPPFLLQRPGFEFGGDLRELLLLIRSGQLRWSNILGVSGLVFMAIGLRSLQEVIVLSRGGGGVIARSLGGQKVVASTADPLEIRLIHVVEEMAIAAGTAVPEIYVLKGEKSINAFAAGLRKEKAVIGITRGALENLTRDELQGVVAHEMSHLINGDSELNTKVTGVVAGILFLGTLGSSMMRLSHGSRRRDSFVPLMLIGLILCVLGVIGGFFGALIQAAVSRQREYLADASAVQLTRNPSGLGGALNKIRKVGSEVRAARVMNVRHLLFADGLQSFWGRMIASHPPVASRLQRLNTSGPRASDKQVTAGGLAAREFRGVVGSVPSQALRNAQSFLSKAPKSLALAIQSPLPASCMMFCLFIRSEDGDQNRCWDILSKYLAPATLMETKRWKVMIDELGVGAFVPLIQWASPALKGLSDAQRLQFESICMELIQSEKKIEPFEYLLLRDILAHMDPRQRLLPKRGSPMNLAKAYGHVLDVVVGLSGSDGARQEDLLTQLQGSFRRLKVDSGKVKELGTTDAESLDAALRYLNSFSLKIRLDLIQEIAMLIAADGVITEKEFGALRSVCSVLGCAVPKLM